MPKALDRIRSVDLRNIWSSEPGDFTPWLAEKENLQLLSDTVNMDLELQSQEVKVGVFRADIVCSDRKTGKKVVVENQLTRSDHNHLGQLLTYAGGLGTAAIIWVAPAFCDEHKIALDWLNQITNEQLRFYAVTVEVLAIGDSRPAPRFRLLAGPKSFLKSDSKIQKKQKAGDNPGARMREEYWRVFLSNLVLRESGISIPQPNSLGNLRFSLRGRDLWITVYAAASNGRIGVFVRGSDYYRSAFRKNRSSIQAILGEDARWEESGDSWYIAVARTADPFNRQTWPSQHQWLAVTLEKFLRAFQPYAESTEATRAAGA